MKYFTNQESAKESQEARNQKRGLIYLLPPLIPLFFYAFLQFFGVPQIRSFLVGVVASIITLYLIWGNSLTKFFKILKRSLSWNFAAAIFGIMIFREMITVTQVNIIIAETISSLPFPTIYMIILIPLLLGVLTGFNLAAIALSFPMVEPLFSLVNINIVYLTSIVFMSSVVGYLISPIHLCNVLSSEYLKTDVTRMYKIFIPSALLLLIFNTAIFVA